MPLSQGTLFEEKNALPIFYELKINKSSTYTRILN